MLFKYMFFRPVFSRLFPEGEYGLVGSLLLRRFLGAALSMSDRLPVQSGLHDKLLIVVGALFSHQHVGKLRAAGYSYAEIAAKLNISESSARVLEHRTRRWLQTTLQKEGLWHDEGL